MTISKREDFYLLNHFCDGLSLGSALECVFVMNLLARNAKPTFLAPTSLAAYFPHPIVCPGSQEFVGNRPFPCLFLDSEIWFPQVSVKTPRLYTLDYLVYGRSGEWRIVEIDGRGHDGREDSARNEALDIPVIRFKEADVLYLTTAIRSAA